MTHQFSDFLENFAGSNGRNRRGIRAVINSVEIYTVNFIMSRADFWVAQPKLKKITIIFLQTSLK